MKNIILLAIITILFVPSQVFSAEKKSLDPIQDHFTVFDIESLLDGISDREIVITKEHDFYLSERNGQVYVDINLDLNQPIVIVFPSKESYLNHLEVPINLNEIFQVAKVNSKTNQPELLAKSIKESLKEVDTHICSDVAIRGWVNAHKGDLVGVGFRSSRGGHTVWDRDVGDDCHWYNCSDNCINRITDHATGISAYVEGDCQRAWYTAWIGCFCITIENF